MQKYLKNGKKINNKVVRASSASSSALAKQIINGAPANIYISASALWIEELSKKKIIVSSTIQPLFENRLVLITNIDSNIKDIGLISNNIELEKIYTYFPRLKIRRKSQAGFTSGGEQQMIAVARAMMAKPKMLLLANFRQNLPQIIPRIFQGRFSDDDFPMTVFR